MPGRDWPGIADPLHITAEDHARHTERAGIPHPSDLVPGAKSTKMAKDALKFVNKPHSMPKRKISHRRKRREQS